MDMVNKTPSGADPTCLPTNYFIFLPLLEMGSVFF